MNQQILIEAQKIMLDILKEVDRICRKHDIKYFLVDGTLLGAIRHEGFIPWDDDIDIGMLREDFEKFKLVALNELNENYFLQTIETDKKYDKLNIPMKVRHNKSKIIEREQKFCEYHSGLFIDIFPYDFCPQNKAKEKFQQILSQFFMSISHDYPQEYNSSNRIKKIIKQFNVKYLSCFKYKFYSVLLKSLRWNKYKNGCYLKYGIETPWYKIKYSYNDIFPLKEIKFEDEFFFAPNNPNNYLKIIYGENYMQLPPVNERKVHAEKIEIYKDKIYG